MVDLNALQKQAYQNKIDKGHDISDINLNFLFINEEIAEAWAAYHKKLPNFHEELADIVILVLGLAEILGIDLEKEIVHKMEKNSKRVYKKINGVNVRVKEADKS